MNRCVIISAGVLSDIGLMCREIKPSDYIITADAGYEYAMQAGLRPHLAVGDFDSYGGPIDAGECIRLPAEKDDTDTLFAAREGLRRGYRTFLLFGALGGRPDHMMANFCVLRFLCENGAEAVLLDGETRVEMLMMGRREITGAPGCTVSIFPFDGVSRGVTLEGLKYPLRDAELTSCFPVGISNVMLSEKASIVVESGPLLIIRTTNQVIL